MNGKKIGILTWMVVLFVASLGPLLLVGISKAGDGDSWTGGYDSANNTDYVQLSSAGHLRPGTDDIVDLGSIGREFRDLYIDGEAHIDTLTIDSTIDLPDDSVTTDHIGAGSITSPKLLDGAVTTAKLGGGAVTATKINDDAVTTSKILSGSVTTAKMYINLPGDRVACITSGKILGTCTATPDSNGGCACS